jgi:hypothetical protein
MMPIRGVGPPDERTGLLDLPDRVDALTAILVFGQLFRVGLIEDTNAGCLSGEFTPS